MQDLSDENCVTLLCVLPAQQGSSVPDPDGDHNDSFQCFCHLLIDLPKITICSAPLAVASYQANEVLICYTAPIRDIDHPPNTIAYPEYIS